MSQLYIPIRTQAGKLYGTLDIDTYKLKIKDGHIIRVIQIPPEGIKLEYSSNNKQSEIIRIPPKSVYSETYK